MWESELEIKDGTGFCSPSAKSGKNSFTLLHDVQT